VDRKIIEQKIEDALAALSDARTDEMRKGGSLPAMKFVRLWELELLLDILNNQNGADMAELIRVANRRLKKNQEIPREWLEFVFERLVEAADIAMEGQGSWKKNIATALRLTKKKKISREHYHAALALHLMEYRHRHKKDPLAEAIREYRETFSHPLEVDTLKTVYNEQHELVVYALSNNKSRQSQEIAAYFHPKK